MLINDGHCARAPAFAILAFGVMFCIGDDNRGEPDANSGNPALAAKSGPEEELPLELETESIESEEIQVLETPPAPAVDVDRRPCSWASAWNDPSTPDPVLPGGPLELRRLDSAQIQLPVRDEVPRGEATVEIVIGPAGNVLEARVVRSFEPEWPEGEAAIRSAVLGWKYEPPRIEGTAVSVCSTFLVRP
jgi:hypothetical protein